MLPTVLEILIPILDVLVVLCLLTAGVLLGWEWIQVERPTPTELESGDCTWLVGATTVGGMPSTPGSSVTGGGALGEEGSLYSLYCLEKLSEKSRMRLKRSLTGHRNGASWPILASVYRPNPRQERPLHPFRTVSLGR